MNFSHPLTAFFCLLTQIFVGQLVNGGFENYSSIPTAPGQWQVVTAWNNAMSSASSPDYYHLAAGVDADIPETPFGIVEPAQGSAIMGFLVAGRPGSNTREYLTACFSSALTIGKKYSLHFKITNGLKTEFSTSGLGVKNFGVLFSTSQPTQNSGQPMIASPQYHYADLLYDKEWHEMSFTFTADQPYRFMTVGLFSDDAQSPAITVEGANPLYAYYFVDDFSLDLIEDPNKPGEFIGDKLEKPVSTFPVTNQDLFFVPNSFTPNEDGNNDSFLPSYNLNKEWQFKMLSVYNRWGDLIFKSTDKTFGWDGNFNGKPADAGVFVWQIDYLKWDESANQWLTTANKGTVNLIR
jgi:gliding motility-associated-like protein